MTDVDKLKAWLELEKTEYWTRRHSDVLIAVCRILLDACEYYSTEIKDSVGREQKLINEAIEIARNLDNGNAARKAIEQAAKVIE